MRVSKMRSTNPTGDDAGSARLSAYSDAPPMMNPRETCGPAVVFIRVIAASKLPSRAAEPLKRCDLRTRRAVQDWPTYTS